MNHEQNFPVASTSSAPSPFPITAEQFIPSGDIKSESDFDSEDSDTDYQPSTSGRTSVASVFSTATSAERSSKQRKKRGRPALPLRKLAPASKTLSKRERRDYERVRNNEASRISRRNKRDQELAMEELCVRLEAENERLERKAQKCEIRKEKINRIVFSMAIR